MAMYNAESPIAIPIYTVLPYCVIQVRKKRDKIISKIKSVTDKIGIVMMHQVLRYNCAVTEKI